jgi:hypothetical protein
VKVDAVERLRRYGAGERAFAGAHLERANLRGAYLSGVCLRGAKLVGTDLTGPT